MGTARRCRSLTTLPPRRCARRGRLPSEISDSRARSPLGLVAGTLGLGAIALPLVGWKNWPEGLTQEATSAPVKLAALPSKTRNELPGPGRVGGPAPGGATPLTAVGLPGGGAAAAGGGGFGGLDLGGGSFSDGSGQPASGSGGSGTPSSGSGGRATSASGGNGSVSDSPTSSRIRTPTATTTPSPTTSKRRRSAPTTAPRATRSTRRAGCRCSTSSASGRCRTAATRTVTG